MNRRLPTIFDDLFPDSSPEFAAIAEVWPESVVVQILTLVWDAFDRLRSLPNFRQLDFSKNYAQLERSLTDLHSDEVALFYAERHTGFESFVPKHEPWEFQYLTIPSARPPSCDIGFVLISNRRIRWAVEAKVLENPTENSGYLGDLDKHLGGTSSPFSNQAALAAYLIAGKPDDVFESLESSLKLPFEIPDAFAARPHRITRHQRATSSMPLAIPPDFVCHHLVFSLT